MIDEQIQNRKMTIGHYEMRDMLHNMSIRQLNSQLMSIHDVSVVEHERAAGAQMSSNIDTLINKAKYQPVNPDGEHSMYWRGGRVLSKARDIFKASYMAKHQPQRIFRFEDCGEKPKDVMFSGGMMCSHVEVEREIQHCCATEACRAKHMP